MAAIGGHAKAPPSKNDALDKPGVVITNSSGPLGIEAHTIPYKIWLSEEHPGVSIISANSKPNHCQSLAKLCSGAKANSS